MYHSNSNDWDWLFATTPQAEERLCYPLAYKQASLVNLCVTIHSFRLLHRLVFDVQLWGIDVYSLQGSVLIIPQHIIFHCTALNFFSVGLFECVHLKLSIRNKYIGIPQYSQLNRVNSNNLTILAYRKEVLGYGNFKRNWIGTSVVNFFHFDINNSKITEEM